MFNLPKSSDFISHVLVNKRVWKYKCINNGSQVFVLKFWYYIYIAVVGDAVSRNSTPWIHMSSPVVSSINSLLCSARPSSFRTTLRCNRNRFRLLSIHSFRIILRFRIVRRHPGRLLVVTATVFVY